MKFDLLHNSYLNPATGEVLEDVSITDGMLKDDPDNQRLEVSFRMQLPTAKTELDLSGEAPREVEVQTVETIAETVLVFDGFERPTMVAVGDSEVDLFKYLADGGQLAGDEKITVGYPTYASVQNYFLKDNLGDKLAIAPDLDDLGKALVEKFLLEGLDRNGRPIGFFGENIGRQFRFGEEDRG